VAFDNSSIVSYRKRPENVVNRGFKTGYWGRPRFWPTNSPHNKFATLVGANLNEMT
jgi:hypothetical protein